MKTFILKYHYLISIFIAILVAIFMIGMTSCSTPLEIAKIYRQDGFNAQWKAFKILPEDSNDKFDYTITIPEMTVRITNYQIPGAQKSGAVGMAYQHPFGIWLMGKKVNGKIHVSQSVLGHEFLHILNFLDSEIANPDRLD
uniref:Uncharacterized protein n=1 Tax=viral metagenome TaxID=1070528 RepID=A0A6M3JQF5_9ZZZZ